MPDYSAERYDPKVQHCGILAMDFDGKQLRLVAGSATYVYKAVSGKSVNGAFDYSPTRQQVKDAGPIPAGKYWIEPAELDDNWINCVLMSNFCAAWGRYRLTIQSTPSRPQRRSPEEDSLCTAAPPREVRAVSTSRARWIHSWQIFAGKSGNSLSARYTSR